MRTLVTIAGGLLVSVAGNVALANGPFTTYPFQTMPMYGGQTFLASPANCPNGQCPLPGYAPAVQGSAYQPNYRLPVTLPVNCPDGQCPLPGNGSYAPGHAGPQPQAAQPRAAQPRMARPSNTYPTANPGNGSSPFYSPAPQPGGPSPWDLPDEETDFNPWRNIDRTTPAAPVSRPNPNVPSRPADGNRTPGPSMPSNGSPFYQ